MWEKSWPFWRSPVGQWPSRGIWPRQWPLIVDRPPLITAVIAQWPSALVWQWSKLFVNSDMLTRCYYTSKTSPPPKRILSWNCAALSIILHASSFISIPTRKCSAQISISPNLGSLQHATCVSWISNDKTFKDPRNEHDPRLALITHRSFAPQIPRSWILMLWNHALRVSIMDWSD